jgi:3-oxoacyl-[acyl-carrier-protein] synthase-3
MSDPAISDTAIPIALEGARDDGRAMRVEVVANRPNGVKAHSAAARAAVLDGIGIALPPRVRSNSDFAASLETSDEWIRSRTGIIERRIADPEVASSDLAYEAARNAIQPGQSDVGAVVVATTTPDHPMPGVAPIVAARLGLRETAAFDVQAACSGFVYALAAGSGLICAGVAQRVLVIGAEVMSRIVDPADRATAVLFGDGAGAVTLRAGDPGEPGAIGPFDLGSEGVHAHQLQVEAGGSRLPVCRETEHRRYLTMDGGHVFRHAVQRMTESSRRVLQLAGLHIDDIDHLVAHQANMRILKAVGDQLGVRPERRVSNVDRCGNTSAASIPIALAHARPRPGERILITAFGSGYTWGSTILTWPQLMPS